MWFTSTITPVGCVAYSRCAFTGVQLQIHAQPIISAVQLVLKDSLIAALGRVITAKREETADNNCITAGEGGPAVWPLWDVKSALLMALGNIRWVVSH